MRKASITAAKRCGQIPAFAGMVVHPQQNSTFFRIFAANVAILDSFAGLRYNIRAFAKTLYCFFATGSIKLKTQHIVIRRVLTALVCFASALFASLSPMEDAAAEGFAYYRTSLLNPVGGWFIVSNYPTQEEARARARRLCSIAAGISCADFNTDANTFDTQYIAASNFTVSGVRYIVSAVGHSVGVATAAAADRCVAISAITLNKAACTTAITPNLQICSDRLLGTAIGVDTDGCDTIAPQCEGDERIRINANTCVLDCPGPNQNDDFKDTGGTTCELVCKTGRGGEQSNGDPDNPECECLPGSDFEPDDNGNCNLVCDGAETRNSAGTECQCDATAGNVRTSDGACIVQVICSGAQEIHTPTNECFCPAGSRMSVAGDDCVPDCAVDEFIMGDSCGVCTTEEKLSDDGTRCMCKGDDEVRNILGICEVAKTAGDCEALNPNFVLDTTRNDCVLSACPVLAPLLGTITPEFRTALKANDAGTECTCPAGQMREDSSGIISIAANLGSNLGSGNISDACVAEVAPRTADTSGGSVALPAQNLEHTDLTTGGAIVGGGLLLIVAGNYLGGGAGVFGFAPDYGYSINDSGYSYNYGGRVIYQNARWNAYWTATQANANGETGNVRYGSGGQYTADFWTAAFSESISGTTADYDFSLSADYNGGIWKLSPVYRIHSRFEEYGKSETDNALNLEAVLRWNRWTVSPSAGFRWENAEDFGDNAKFGVRAVREF